jgi:hypothetical protein
MAIHFHVQLNALLVNVVEHSGILLWQEHQLLMLLPQSLEVG